MPVTFPWSPSAQPPLMVYVPVNRPGEYVPVRALSVILPVKVVTCPPTGVEVREMLPPVRVPVRPMVVMRSKQFEPSTCTAPLTELPDRLILPAIVRGGIPDVDVVLNCQLPELLWPCAGGPESGPEGGLEGECEVPGPPPHPHSSTRTESTQEKLDGILVPNFIVRPPVSLESVISSVAMKNAPSTAESNQSTLTQIGCSPRVSRWLGEILRPGPEKLNAKQLTFI